MTRLFSINIGENIHFEKLPQARAHRDIDLPSNISTGVYTVWLTFFKNNGMLHHNNGIAVISPILKHSASYRYDKEIR